MKSINIVLSLIIFVSCTTVSYKTAASDKEEINSKGLISDTRTLKKVDGVFYFATQYWAVPRTVAAGEWHAVFGGTVVKVKSVREKYSGDITRKFVSGVLKVEKIFLNLPANSEISINSLISSEGFDGLRKGDKVVFFVNSFYEKSFTRIYIDGTNSRLGLKVKNWNEPIVAVLEKIAPCAKVSEKWIEGHDKNFRKPMYECQEEREKMILDQPEFSKIWKYYDPKGFQELLERRKFLNEN